VAGLVAYRSAPATAGLFVKFEGSEGREALQALIEDQAALEQEVGQPLRFLVGVEADRVAGELSLDFKAPEGGHRDESQMSWLLSTSNALVNALRPRLAGKVS